MVVEFIKSRLNDYFNNNVLPDVRGQLSDLMYQQLFDLQCRNAGIRNEFYPVGAAASHSLMYLLTRMLGEFQFEAIVELGSGQTTQLIERMKRGARHVCYEHDPIWHGMMRDAFNQIDSRLRPLQRRETHGVGYDGYSDPELGPFDFLLVDGPPGVDSYSRFSCVEWIDANSYEEFVIIIDDAERSGEQDTIRFISELLNKRGLHVKVNTLVGRTTQAVFTTPRFRAVSYYY